MTTGQYGCISLCRRPDEHQPGRPTTGTVSTAPTKQSIASIRNTPGDIAFLRHYFPSTGIKCSFHFLNLPPQEGVSFPCHNFKHTLIRYYTDFCNIAQSNLLNSQFPICVSSFLYFLCCCFPCCRGNKGWQKFQVRWWTRKKDHWLKCRLRY